MIDASLRVDPDRRLGPVQPMVLGQFIEHLGRCIYGGIFEPGSPLADEDGFRTDVLEAFRRLRPPILRWPGGNFASGYHWLDGVGPVSDRPTRYDRAWRKAEPNTFGTHEFIRYCRLLGSEPYLCVNMGSGTLDEAASWVEYCNRESGTHYADLRQRNGAAEPFRVRYWGLGNEVYGPWQIGQMSAAEYAYRAREFAKIMRLTDGDIRLIACGAHDPEWEWEVLKTAGQSIDYLSIHSYFRPESADPYYSLLAWPAIEEEYVRDLHHLTGAARRRYGILRPISIAFDEWNVQYRTLPESVREDPRLEEPYSLGDALCVAAFLNMLRRCSDAVGMANFAQTVNVLGAILTRTDGLVLQTVYYPLAMQADIGDGIVLDALAESDQFETRVSGRQYSVGYLDACATLDEAARTLALSCVNFHHSQGMRLRLVGVSPAEATIHILSGPDPDAANTFESPDAVTVRTETQKVGADGVIELGPHSANVVELRLS
jgi:alpha-N-arabinofuranosidase